MDCQEPICTYKSQPKYCQITAQDLMDNPITTLSKLLYNRSLTHSYLDHTNAALLDITKSIDLDPTNYKAYLQRGNLFYSVKNFRSAYTDFKKVLEINTNSKTAKDKAELARKSVLQQIIIENLKNSNRSTNNNTNTVKQVPKLLQKESDLDFDFNNFTTDDAIKLIAELRSEKMLKQEVVSKMISKIREMHELLPNIVNISRPKTGNFIKVVGDTHGQFQDLLYIFDKFGNPSSESPYLFNGDYVDRGSQGLEILLTLFAWKIANPDSIYFNRGNHETDLMNFPYGFENECSAKLSPELFRKFSNMFGALPVGHIIGDKVLVVHGGLFSDETVTIDTIQGFNRFGQPPEQGPMNDILWSDPMDSPGHAPSPRGVTQTFGPDVTERFLAANNLELLIRSHQVQEQGYLIQHNGKCITVFSAPNYIGRIGNKGAIVYLSFDEDGKLNPPKFEQFTAQPIPTNFKPMKFSNLSALLMKM